MVRNTHSISVAKFSLLFSMFAVAASSLQAFAQAQAVRMEKPPDGVLELKADKTILTKGHSIVEGTANTTLQMAGQNSFMSADDIQYSPRSGYVDAIGNVKIIKNGKIKNFEHVLFHIYDTNFLITNKKKDISYIRVVDRSKKAYCMFDFPWPFNLAISPPGQPFFPMFASASPYRSKFANQQLFSPETASDWGRDKYGIANAIFGSPLNGSSNPFEKSAVIVSRVSYVPGKFEFQFTEGPKGLPVLARAAKSGKTSLGGELFPVTKIAKRVFYGKWPHIDGKAASQAVEINADPIECSILCAYETFHRPPMGMRQILDLKFTIAQKEREENRPPSPWPVNCRNQSFPELDDVSWRPL